MKQLLLFFILWISFLPEVSAQRVTLIKTGRPQTFEYNNAERVVGKKWGITFGYFAFNGTDFDALDSINAINQVSEDKLTARKGTGWREQFTKEVNAELEKQNRFRKLIVSKLTGINLSDEWLIHFEPGKCKNHYKAYWFSGGFPSETDAPDEPAHYSVRQVYKVNTARKKIKLISDQKQPIHFEYPENGII